jgi:hypothetical protein
MMEYEDEVEGRSGVEGSYACTVKVEVGTRTIK